VPGAGGAVPGLNPLLKDLHPDVDEGEGSVCGRRPLPKEVVVVQKLLPIPQPTRERGGQMQMGRRHVKALRHQGCIRHRPPQKKPLAFAAEAEDRVIDYALYFSKQFET
jgi:hypothetical protein